MNYSKLRESLTSGETLYNIVAHGNSMSPRIENRARLTLVPVSDHSVIEIGDVVFCKVNGNYYFHLVKSKKHIKEKWMFLIGNNHGHDNGWTSQVFGKVLI